MLVMSLAFFLLGAVGLITAYALLQDKALEHKFHVRMSLQYRSAFDKSEAALI